MKLFQQLLVAPAALGLIAPMAANAAELNINEVSDYASGSEVQSFSDVYPTDWAFKALTSLAERHGCAVATPAGSITRFEAATLVEKCLGNVAQANEEERRLLNEFAPEIAVIKGRIDGLESRVGEFEAGQFSNTTTLSGKAAFIVGSVAASDETTGATTMEYMYQMNMNTSFTGEDKLYTRIKSGNVSDHFTDKSNGTYLSAANGNADVLEIDKIWYQFPIGDSLQFWVGPRIENYYMLASAPSIYQPVLKQFALGGNGPVYGSSTTGGFGGAWTQQVDDASTPRFAVSAGFTSKGDQTSTDDNGMFGGNSATALLTKAEYGNARWQVSVAAAFKEGAWQDEYFATDDALRRSASAASVASVASVANSTSSNYSAAVAAVAAVDRTTETALGLRAHWKPEETGVVPSVQFGYDTTSIEGQAAGYATEAAGWMVGLGWSDVFVDGNKAGFAFGSRVHGTKIKGGGTDPAEDNTSWEAYYSFKVNDNVNVTPTVFANNSPSDGSGDDNNNGILILTNFKF